MVMIYCSTFGLRFFSKVSALRLKPFESVNSHNHKPLSFWVVFLFLCCLRIWLNLMHRCYTPFVVIELRYWCKHHTQFNYNNSYAVTASNSVVAPPSSYVVCVTALLTCCRAVEQIKGVYCSAQPAQYGICSTASQFESVSLVYCLEAMVCAV